MMQTDPTLAKIAAVHQIRHHAKSRRLHDRRPRHLEPDRAAAPIFYWSNVKGRWTTFGNMGRMKLILKSAHEIVENDPMFRVSRPW
jgi:hypothetical protein